MSINCDSSLWCIGGEAECGHSLNCLPSLIFHLHEVDAPIPSNFRWEQRQNKLQMVGSLGWRANNRKVEDWGHIGALIPICLMAEPSCAWYALRKNWSVYKWFHTEEMPFFYNDGINTSVYTLNHVNGVGAWGGGVYMTMRISHDICTLTQTISLHAS